MLSQRSWAFGASRTQFNVPFLQEIVRLGVGAWIWMLRHVAEHICAQQSVPKVQKLGSLYTGMLDDASKLCSAQS